MQKSQVSLGLGCILEIQSFETNSTNGKVTCYSGVMRFRNGTRKESKVFFKPEDVTSWGICQLPN